MINWKCSAPENLFFCFVFFFTLVMKYKCKEHSQCEQFKYFTYNEIWEIIWETKFALLICGKKWDIKTIFNNRKGVAIWAFSNFRQVNKKPAYSSTKRDRQILSTFSVFYLHLLSERADKLQPILFIQLLFLTLILVLSYKKRI